MPQSSHLVVTNSMFQPLSDYLINTKYSSLLAYSPKIMIMFTPYLFSMKTQDPLLNTAPPKWYKRRRENEHKPVKGGKINRNDNS